MLLNSSRHFPLKAGGVVSRAIVGERLGADGAQEAVGAGFLIAQADVSRTTRCDGLSCLRGSRLAGALADGGEHVLHGVRLSSATLDQALGQIVSGVSAAKGSDAGDAGTLIGRSLSLHRLDVDGRFHGFDRGLGLVCGRGRGCGLELAPDSDGDISRDRHHRNLMGLP